MAATFSVKSQDGKILSNLSVAEVKRLFDEGKINDHDMISKDGSGQYGIQRIDIKEEARKMIPVGK